MFQCVILYILFRDGIRAASNVTSAAKDWTPATATKDLTRRFTVLLITLRSSGRKVTDSAVVPVFFNLKITLMGN